MTEQRALVNYDEEWAKQAEAYAQQEQVSGGTFLSTRSGMLSFGDEVMPGNQVCAVVIDSVKENTFYSERYSEERPESPRCYAFGRGTDTDPMGPHPSMQVDLSYFAPQHHECNGCPMNMWGTADVGRGKACQNRRRLALLPAGYYQPRRGSRDFDLHLFTDPNHFASADVAYLKLPVTSVKEWGKYVTQLAVTLRKPPHAVLTRIYLEPHPKFQFQVGFEMIGELPIELAPNIMARNAGELAKPFQGYSVPEEQPAPAQQGLRGLRR